MTVPTAWVPLTDPDPIMTIAEDLFATMVDGEPGRLVRWHGERPALTDPRHTWVDVIGDDIARVVISMGRHTGEAITRVLFALDESSEVSDMDFVDALGELANVVGGNVKSLVTHPGTLTLPAVEAELPPLEDATCLVNACLVWNEAPICVGLWVLPRAAGIDS